MCRSYPAKSENGPDPVTSAMLRLQRSAPSGPRSERTSAVVPPPFFHGIRRCSPLRDEREPGHETAGYRLMGL